MARGGSVESIKLIALPLGSIVVAFVIATLLAMFWMQGTIDNAHRRALITQKADDLQYRLNLQQAELIKQLRSIASSPRLVELVKSGDASLRSSAEARLNSEIADAIKVRLFGVGQADVDRGANPPFSFTSLDLVNRAEAGVPVFPEAIKFENKWILSVAAPLSPPDEDTIYGTLFVYLDMASIIDGMNGSLDGQITLLQSFQNAPANEILKVGNASGASSRVTRELDNPHWQIQFRPDAALTTARVGTPMLLVLPLGLFLAIALIGVFAGIRRIQKAVDTDTTHLSNQITDVLKNDFTPSSDYEFASFVDLDANLVRLGKKPEEPRAPVEPIKTATPRARPRQEEMVDIEMIDEDTYEQELQKTRHHQEEPREATGADIAAIFRAYDIRGIVNVTLTEAVIKRIGLAIGSEAGEQGEQTLVVGADGRVSSPAMMETLIEGLRESGRDVINIGSVPTPVLYYATRNTDATSGVMVTGSHNPPDYNGFKIVLGGRTLVERDIQQLYQRFVSEEFTSGDGDVTEVDIRDDYMDAISDDVVVAQPLKIIVDCGNGIAGNIAPELFANLGCDVIPLYCEVDGTFPNHHPDPTVPENLDDLILMVKSQQADVGIALDGDGDRVVAITKSGQIVWPDRLLMLFAKDVVSRNPGSDVVYDVKCTRHLNTVISGFGGRPIICRSGHSFVKEKMAETGALLGGELSGHICFTERWTGFDDGLYAAARLLEIIGTQSEGLDELLAEFPASATTPEIHVPVPDDQKFQIVRQVIESWDFPDGTVSTTDGLRVDFSDGWGLLRASNTNPALTLRFEANDDAGLQKIKQMFREKLQAIDSHLDF